MEKGLKDGLTDTPSKTTIKVSNELRDKLAEIGNKGETFEDIIKRLISKAGSERSGEIITSKSAVIQYKRKKEFIKLATFIFDEATRKRLKDISLPNQKDFVIIKVGIEYEYNIPPRKEGDWELDIQIVKVYYNNKPYNPSEFFGVNNEKKYLSHEFIRIYFQVLADIFYKEFGIPIWKAVPAVSELSIMGFRNVYYKYNLSQESFINDVEDVLRDFSDREINDKIKKQLQDSIVGY